MLLLARDTAIAPTDLFKEVDKYEAYSAKTAAINEAKILQPIFL